MSLGRFDAACETHPILPCNFLDIGGSPKIRTAPEWSFNTPRMLNNSVDFPLPLGPTSPTNSPFDNRRSMSRRIILPERLTDTLLTSSMRASSHTFSTFIEFITKDPSLCSACFPIYINGARSWSSSASCSCVLKQHTSYEEEKSPSDKNDRNEVNRIHDSTSFLSFFTGSSLANLSNRFRRQGSQGSLSSSRGSHQSSHLVPFPWCRGS